jgi:hypothetical protein
MDILRKPENEAVLALLTQRTPPFLYHRESCQVVHVTPAKGKGKAPVYVDKDRIRAWAKGRYLPRPTIVQREGDKVRGPTVMQQEDNAISQEELLEDLALTPEQREGKRKIQERTEEKAKKRRERK